MTRRSVKVTPEMIAKTVEAYTEMVESVIEIPQNRIGEVVDIFMLEEDSRSYCIGCPDFRTRKAFIFAIEACRQLCACENAAARKLFTMALIEMENK